MSKVIALLLALLAMSPEISFAHGEEALREAAKTLVGIAAACGILSGITSALFELSMDAGYLRVCLSAFLLGAIALAYLLGISDLLGLALVITFASATIPYLFAYAMTREMRDGERSNP